MSNEIDWHITSHKRVIWQFYTLNLLSLDWNLDMCLFEPQTCSKLLLSPLPLNKILSLLLLPFLWRHFLSCQVHLLPSLPDDTQWVKWLRGSTWGHSGEPHVSNNRGAFALPTGAQVWEKIGETSFSVSTGLHSAWILSRLSSSPHSCAINQTFTLDRPTWIL